MLDNWFGRRVKFFVSILFKNLFVSFVLKFVTQEATVDFHPTYSYKLTC